MVYSKYGITFRRIREQKKLSLSIFPPIGISKPALSKFERGETMMGFENVVRALQEMGVSLEEYENFLNSYSATEEEELWEEIEQSAMSTATEKLRELQSYARERGFYFMALAIKSCHTKLEGQEAEEVTEYLYDVEMWSFCDLRLLYFSMENLKVKDLYHIMKRFFPSGHELFNSKKHRQYFFRVCCRAVIVFSRNGYGKEAKIILEQMDVHNLAQTMFQRNLKQLTEGYWNFYFYNRSKGEGQLREGLEGLRSTSLPEEFSYYVKRYGLV